MNENMPSDSGTERSATDGHVATILFVDQVGSTGLLASLGDAAMVTIRGELWALFTSAVAEHGGRVLSDEGDGGSAVFDFPLDATRAGLAMLAATSGRSELTLRVGCNTGPVFPTATGMVGLAIHVAARVCDAAPARHLAATDATVAALAAIGAPLRYTSVGRRNMKGLPEPVALSLISGLGAAEPSLDRLELPRSSPLLEETVDASHFVGRVDEIVRLHRSLFPPQKDGSNVVLLAGDPGSGKTALAYHVARGLSDDGVVCLIGRSDEALDDPLVEIVEMLRHVVPTMPIGGLTDHFDQHGTIVSRLFPELVERLGVERPTDDIVPDRQRLFAAIGDLVTTLAATQPVVLVLEDLHWTSTQTLDLLRSLLRSNQLPGVSLLVTLRPHDTSLSTEASDFLSWLTSDRHPVRIDLDPLRQDEVAHLCRSLLDAAADDVVEELARHLLGQTGGNALFCSEMLRSLQDNAALFNAGDIDLGSLVVVPPTVQELAVARVRKLGAETADVLADAAVLGESFDIADLRSMSPHDTLASLDLAERAGLVRSDDAVGTRVTFGHALVQQALYHQQTSIARLRRHRAAADAMHTGDPARVRARSFDRLHHLRNAGSLVDRREVASAAGAAALAAADKLALADSIRFRELAVEELTAAGAPPEELAVAVSELGRAQTANALQIGKATMASAAELARRASDWDLFADIAIGYGGDLKENQAAADVSEPVALLSGALERHRAPTARRALLLSAMAVWQRQHRPYAERREAVDEALEIARGLGDPRTLAMILSERHRALHGPNAVREAMDASIELEDLANDAGSSALMFQAMYLRVIASMELGDWDMATAGGERLLSVGAKLQNLEGRRVSAMWSNLVAQVRGDWGEGHRQVGELAAVIADYPHADLVRMLGAASFIGIWFEHGAGALHRISEASDGAGGRPATRAWFAAEAGEVAEAMRWIELAPTVAELEVSLDYMWWHDTVSLTRAAVALGDRALAAELYRAMLPYRSSNAMMGFAAFMGAVEHHLGTLAVTLGRADDAREHFARAARRHESMGAVPFGALTAKELASLG